MQQPLGMFPQRRLRRNRSTSFIRELCQQHKLHSQDFIYPVFLLDHDTHNDDILSMPGVQRLGFTGLCKVAESCLELGVPALALFPFVDQKYKSLDASEAFNPEGLVPRRVRELKKRFPELGVITDVALDPYTSHGQDGLLDSKGYVVNDQSVGVLKQQALCHAESGADIVAPSDMMDGRVGVIRNAFEEHSFYETKILSYSAKYASAFYGPFRDAVGSQKSLGAADKRTYQMSPANSDEALHEIAQDLEEGADLVMVKPAGFYLDIIQRVKSQFVVPTFAYQVSGEYSMLKQAAQQKLFDEKDIVLESLLAIKRAGADAIFSYFALEAARYLRQ